MLIKANYDDLQRAAGRLRQQSQDCETRIRQITSSMEQTSEIWQGEDSQTFASQAKSLQPHLLRLTEIMKQYSDVLLRTSGIYRELQQNRARQAANLL